MDVGYKNTKTARLFDLGRTLEKYHGTRQAKLIRHRIRALQAAENLAEFWPPKSGVTRCHELTMDKAGKFSMDLDHPYRLIFEPDHQPVPKLADGGTDWSAITAITILGVEDTHDKKNPA